MNITPDLLANAIKGFAQGTSGQGLPTGLGTKAGAGAAGSFDANLFLAQKLMSMESGGGAKDMEALEFGLCKDALALEAMVTLSKLSQSGEAQDSLMTDLRTKAAKAYGRAVQAMSPNEPSAPAQSPEAISLDAKPPVTGELSARFESGTSGPATVSWDKVGGTSYGTFQLSSKAGTVDNFLDFLQQHMPQWAERLSKAGPADTGSASGAMPDAWRAIASENSDLFASLQQRFITDSHYGGAASAILEATGIEVDKLPPALREVVFSTAVQHGAEGAASIFSKAFQAATGSGDAGELLSSLIENIYQTREKDFPSSTPQVRQSVKNRLHAEKQVALSMLGTPNVNALI